MKEQGITVTAEEHWARKGPVSLYLLRKYAPELQDTAHKRAPLILVHGSSLSALPTFDLTVPNVADYSFMDWLARRGWDVWTLDHEGYGRSTITDGNSDVACGVQDLSASSQLISKVTNADAFNLYGLSSGALRAAAFASAEPARAVRLVLDAFVWTGKGSPTLAKRKEGVEFFQTHNRRAIDRDFVASIFTRDLPGTSEAAVIDACAAAQLQYSDSVPTGTYLDMTTKLPLVDPAAIKAATLIVRGEHDGIATMEDLLAFFHRLPSGEKQFSVLAGLAHCTPLGLRRHVLWHAVDNFPSAGAE